MRHLSSPQVWDRIVVDQRVAEYLNASVYAPIAKRFPDVRFSNFAQASPPPALRPRDG